MVYSTNNLRFPAYGRANQPQVAAGRPGQLWADGVEEIRKGRLYLLAGPDAEPDLLAGLGQRYYSSPRYDTIPALESAMVWSHQEHHGLRGEVLLAAVVYDLSLYVVSTPRADAYLYRSGQVTPLLATHSFRTVYRLTRGVAVHESGSDGLAGPADTGAGPQPDGGGTERYGPERLEDALVLHNTVNRLSFGDWVVFAPKCDLRVMEAAVRSGVRQGDLERAAGRVAAVLKKRAHVVAPVGVMAMRGLSPVPGEGLTPRPQPPLQQPIKPLAMPPPREGPSPIWIALIIATVAVAIAIWASRPQINVDDLTDLFTGMLTPSPTATLTTDADTTPPPVGEGTAP